MQIRRLIVTTVLLIFGYAGSASAIPSLQLGPGSGNWTFDAVTKTWGTSDNPLELIATANSLDGNGAFAWDPAGATSRVAYLVISAVPKVSTDVFDVSVVNDGGILNAVASGFGTPPISDPNDLAPHGIYPTYYEIYEFNFDGAKIVISNTQPGKTDTGFGFSETFNITINSLADGAQLHMDLFTMKGDGTLANNTAVSAFAPFSHDAETIPEPNAALLFGIGVLVVARSLRRR